MTMTKYNYIYYIKRVNLGQFPELKHKRKTCKTLRLPQK